MATASPKCVLFFVTIITATLLSGPAPAFAKSPVPLNASLYGTARQVSFGGISAISTTSALSGSTYGGVTFRTPKGSSLTLAGLSTLGTDYYIQTGDCAGGAPRFTIFLSSGDIIYVWSGSSSGTWFTPACTTGKWMPTPNLANPSSTYAVVSGGPFGGGEGTWSALLGDTCPKGGVACGSLHVTYISLDVDGGWTVNGGVQTILFFAITVNGYMYP